MTRKEKPKRIPVRIQTIVGACRGGADALLHPSPIGCGRRAHVLAGAVPAQCGQEVSRRRHSAWASGSIKRWVVRFLSDMADTIMSAISQQASAVDAALRIISGAAPTKPSAKERDYLIERLRSASATLRWVEMHEDKVRAAVERPA